MHVAGNNALSPRRQMFGCKQLIANERLKSECIVSKQHIVCLFVCFIVFVVRLFVLLFLSSSSSSSPSSSSSFFFFFFFFLL